MREGVFAATVAMGAKVNKRNGIRGGLSLLCVRGFFAATVTMDAKVNKRNGIRDGLSLLCVRGFSQPRSPRAQRLGHVAAIASFA